MTPSDQQFFVDQLIEPVQILEIRQDATSHAYHQFEALSAHVQRTQNFPYTCRLMFVSQTSNNINRRR